MMKVYEIVNLEDGYGIEIDGHAITEYIGRFCHPISWSYLWQVRLEIWLLKREGKKIKNRQDKIDKMRDNK